MERVLGHGASVHLLTGYVKHCYTGIMEIPSFHFLDEPRRLAIELAAAQWARSPVAVSAAYDRMSQIGIGKPEIEANRRATSADGKLAPLLRYAVTLLITKGHLSPEDRALIRREGITDVLLAEVAAVTARAFLRISLLESLGTELRVPRIDVEIGDY